MPRPPERLTVRMDFYAKPSWVEELDAWRNEQEFCMNRAEAIRTIVSRYIRADKPKRK